MVVGLWQVFRPRSRTELSEDIDRKDSKKLTVYKIIYSGFFAGLKMSGSY